MPEIKVTASNFSLSSRWKCKYKYHGTQSYGSYEFETGPTTGSTNVTFSFNIPSGAQIKSAGIYANVSSPYTGFSAMTMNGVKVQNKNGVKYWNIGSAISGGSYSARFQFRANGNKKDTNQHTSTITYSNVYLLIEYDNATPKKAETKASTVSSANEFHIPPQSVCIYNQETKAVYLFDGVIKIQHSFTSKIEEEPSKKKEEFINNARNEPDKLVLDVIMSDVYSDSGDMTKSSAWDESEQQTAFNATKNYVSQNGVWSRSAYAVFVLRKLKEARTLLSVVTPQYVHANMIIASVAVNQDAETPFGWQGQVEFRHKYKDASKKANNSKAKITGTIDDPSGASGISSIVS